MLDSLNDLLGPHIFPAKGDGGDPRLCPVCGKGQLSLKLGKFGAFIGCSNYPECKFTRVLSPTGRRESGEGDRPGVRVLGDRPGDRRRDHAAQRPLRRLCAAGRGRRSRSAASLPKGLAPDDVTLEQALALLALPREVAKHPTSGEPILAGIGRYGAYVQHGKTYANLGKDDDVLEIGGNRAIDLIVAKESGAGGSRFGGDAGRALGEHPEGGAVTVKQGRFGSYVNWGKINATLPKGTDPAALTLDGRCGAARRQGGRAAAEAAACWATIQTAGRSRCATAASGLMSIGARSTRPSRSRRRRIRFRSSEALELFAEREGKPSAARRVAAKTAKTATTKKAAPAKAVAKPAARKTAKKAPAKKAAAKKKPAKTSSAKR